MPEEATKEPTLEGALGRDNLRAAWLAVKANHGAPGVDGMDIGATAARLRQHWEKIEAKLRAGEYQPGAVRAVDIPKGNGGTRTPGIPNVLDRTIQQAIHQVLSPVWEPDFSEHSHGFRPGRSAHDAVREAQAYIQAGKTWVVDIDLKSFFDQVNHDKLMGLVARKVRDKRLLRLIGDYLRAPLRQPDGSRQKRHQGTPQGGPLSPLLASIYLDPLDKELESRGLAFVRYADDIAIFASSQRSAERIHGSVVDWIEKHLKVEVNREKSGSGPSDRSSLPGFRLYCDGRIGIAPKAIVKLKEPLAKPPVAARPANCGWMPRLGGGSDAEAIVDAAKPMADAASGCRPEGCGGGAASSSSGSGVRTASGTPPGAGGVSATPALATPLTRGFARGSKDKVRELRDARQSMTSEQLRDQWSAYIRGWWNCFQLADWRREVQDLSGWIRRHMRKCFWIRWKTPRGRFNALRRLGVKGRSLGNAWCAKGAWPMARHHVLQQALKNKTLETYGFTIPWSIAVAGH
jgi:RNA-directed DNA polymerase